LLADQIESFKSLDDKHFLTTSKKNDR